MKKKLRLKRILLTFEDESLDRSLLYGISEYARLQGNWTLLNNRMMVDPTIHADIYENLKKWEIDGVFLRNPHESIIKRLADTDMPMIISAEREITDRYPGVPVIITNEESIGETAAKYFLNRHFENFAFIGYNKAWCRTRGEAFSRNISKFGHKTPMYFFEKTKQWEKETTNLSKWLKSLKKPNALFACNDEIAVKVCNACFLCNIQIPEEVAILGVDNDEMTCLLSSKPISSIALQMKKAGYEIANLLDQLMSGTEMKGQKINNIVDEVISRESTRVFAIEDDDIREALNFITIHAREPIQIKHVASAVGISEWSLSKKFRETLGTTINKELTINRIQIIKDMLSSKLSISEVALSLSFTDLHHMSRFFKKETGMSPNEYRASLTL